jgi:AraC family transcriptional regulator, regulatory protein of adaptative response / methylated-DNA-[protein]-cysteine methyltransferase
MLGMTPSRYRAGGANEEIKFAVGQTSIGAILVASSKRGVAAILLGDDPDQLVRNLQDRFPKARLHWCGSGIRDAGGSRCRPS